MPTFIAAQAPAAPSSSAPQRRRPCGACALAAFCAAPDFSADFSPALSIAPSGDARHHPAPDAACPVQRQYRLGRGDLLYRMDEAPRDAVYYLRSGHVKLCQPGADGVQRIVDFRGPGDWLGVDALGQAAHHASAVALDDAVVDAVPWQRLAPLLARQPSAGAAFSLAVGRDIARQQACAALMRISDAGMRVARFLLQLAAARSPDQEQVSLPMTRQELADYLGLTSATVSRVMNQLRRDGALQFRRRGFVPDAPGALALAAGVDPRDPGAIHFPPTWNPA